MQKIKYIFFTVIIALFLIGYNTTYAQFGKNKVQYQDFNWKYIQSKHFDVYFYDSKYLAEATAVYAEMALQSIRQTLDYRINKRISIIVYDTHNEFQQTNVIDVFMSEGVGGVTELKKNRVVVPYQGDYAQLKHVIHHELVHGVLNDMFYGGSLQTAVASGRNINFPLWMNEGLAEWESIGGLDTQTDMFMRDVVLSENLNGLESLNGYYAYRGGQCFYWYVAEKYGDEKVGDLVNRVGVYGVPDIAFKSSFHMSFEDFSKQWVKDMKKYYLPDIEKYEHPEDYAKRITNHKKDGSYYNSSPAISPDGEKMVYISAYGANYGIYISDFKEKDRDIELLVNSNRMQDFEDLNMLTPGISWNPSGDKIAISAKAGGEDAVFIVDAEDGDYDKLTFGIKAISSVNWSPDGRFLVFSGSKFESSNLYIYDMEKEELRQITDDVFAELIPVWSHDSKHVYFVSDRLDKTEGKYTKDNFRIWNHDVDASDIYSIDIISQKIERLTNDPGNQKTSLAPLPDGSGILFVSDANGIGNVYQLDFNTSEAKARTNSLTGITQISLSDDASKLLFSTSTNGSSDIFMIKFPLDRPILDSLPNTKFIQNEIDKQKLIAEISEEDLNDIENSLVKSKSLKGYGDFEVEFSRQQLVKPNPDASEKEVEEEKYDAESIVDTSFAEKDYKIKFTPDLILGNPGYSTYWGFQGVAQVLFSDVLGDHQIYIQANLLLDLKNSDILVGYYYLPESIDYSISAFTQSDYATRSDYYIYRFRNWGLTGGASYPFDRYNRLDFQLSLMNTSMENIETDDSPYNISRTLIVPELQYVHDDVQYGYFYAPVSGSRYNLTARATPDIGGNGISFMTFKMDYRRYFRLNELMSFAIRGSAGKSFGSNPQTFYLGGTTNWINVRLKDGILPLDEPQDYAFMEFVMPMRGVMINEASGSQYFLTNTEFRFPLVMAWLPGMIFQNFMGALFLDVGGAWEGDISNFKSTTVSDDDKTIPNDLLMSTGLGIRSFVLGLPLKLDISWQHLHWNWSKPYYMVSLGFDF